MGTGLRSIVLMVVALSVGLTAVAWAAPEEGCDKPAVAEVKVDPTLELGVTQNAKGTVYFYDERRPEALATIGMRHGLRPDAMVAIVRKGEIVAEGFVKDVRMADCIVYPAPGTPAGQILVGDDVRVLVNGPREAMDAKIRREHGDRKLGSIAAYALLFGCIWAETY